MIRSRDELKAHLEAGGAVRCEMRHEPEPKTIWSDPRTGQSVHGSAVKWAMTTGLMRGLSDGLFDDAAQTFVAA